MRRHGMVGWLAAMAACAPHAPRTTYHAPLLEEQVSGATAVLQAVSAVSERVAWVTGHSATVLRTTDGGATWERLTVTGADSGLQFRDVHARDARTAWVLAAGPGERSRIYRTDDGGATWALQFRNEDPNAFYDCFAFFDRRRGVVVSDAVDGHLVIRLTGDGGRHWEAAAPAALPDAFDSEGAFAASGTCLVSVGSRHAWIGTGTAVGSRVYRSDDGGRSWRVAEVPVVSGAASGVASVAFRDARMGVALGGRIAVAADTSNHVAVTRDGGVTWTRAGRPAFAGAVFGSAWVPGVRTPTLVAVGPGGMSASGDDGATWTSLSTNAYWAVGIASPRAGWAVGPRGRITKLRFE